MELEGSDISRRSLIAGGVAVGAGLSAIVGAFAKSLQSGSARYLAMENILWYDKPAMKWVEALPLGNGRIGAMVFGQPESDRIQLNESTLWAGGPHDYDNPEALGALPEIRRLDRK